MAQNIRTGFNFLSPQFKPPGDTKNMDNNVPQYRLPMATICFNLYPNFGCAVMKMKSQFCNPKKNLGRNLRSKRRKSFSSTKKKKKNTESISAKNMAFQNGRVWGIRKALKSQSNSQSVIDWLTGLPSQRDMRREDRASTGRRGHKLMSCE